MNRMYELRSCGCRAVIRHSDIAEVKKYIFAGGTK